MRTAIFAASFAVLTSISGAALGADVYSKGSLKDAPVYVPVQTWTGFYIGGGGGYGSVNHDLSASFSRREETPVSATLEGIGGEGGFGTVQVGYDQQVGSKVVIGVFADYDFAEIESKASLSIFGQSASAKATLTDQWSVGGRLGYLFNPNTLAYFVGGYTEATLELPFGLKDKDFSGYFVGGGLETQIGGGWNVKLEYRYSEFDRESIVVGPIRVSDDLTEQTVRGVLTYKFNSFGPDFTAPLK